MGEPVTDRLQCFDGEREGAFLLSPFVDEYLKHSAGASVSPLALRRVVAMAMRRAHAAGYARAERDVVAWLRHQAAEHERLAINAWGAGLAKSSDEHGQSAARIKLDATAIERGAHRGAAKEGT